MATGGKCLASESGSNRLIRNRVLVQAISGAVRGFSDDLPQIVDKVRHSDLGNFINSGSDPLDTLREHASDITHGGWEGVGRRRPSRSVRSGGPQTPRRTAGNALSLIARNVFAELVVRAEGFFLPPVIPAHAHASKTERSQSDRVPRRESTPRYPRRLSSDGTVGLGRASTGL